MLIPTLLLAACAASSPAPTTVLATSEQPPEPSTLETGTGDHAVDLRAADVTPPRVAFVAPTTVQYAYGPVTFHVHASDDTGLASLTLRCTDTGEEVVWAVASGVRDTTHDFTLASLAPGDHRVVAKAVDAWRNTTTTAELLIHILFQDAASDRTAPRIDITSPAAAPLTVAAGTRVKVAGRVLDGTRLTSLRWALSGASSAQGVLGNDFSWTLTLPGIAEGASTLTLTAVDGATPANTGTRTLAITATAPGGGGGGGGTGDGAQKETSGAICGLGSGLASLLLTCAALGAHLGRRRIE